MTTKLNINAISDNSIPLSKLVQEDVDNALANVNVDLSEYAKLSDIPSHDNFVTKDTLPNSIVVGSAESGFMIPEDSVGKFVYGINKSGDFGLFLNGGDAGTFAFPETVPLTLDIESIDEDGRASLSEDTITHLNTLMPLGLSFNRAALFTEINGPEVGDVCGYSYITMGSDERYSCLRFTGISDSGTLIQIRIDRASDTNIWAYVKTYDLATTSYVDQKVADGVSGIDLSSYATKTEIQEVTTSMSENELVVSAALTDLNERMDELQAESGAVTPSQITEIQQTLQTLRTEIDNIKAELVKTLNVE